MILTQAHLNIRRSGAKKLLGSPQAMHAAILSGFAPGVDPGRPLWRVDTDDELRPTLYVVSTARPDLTHLEEQAGWPSQPTARSISYDSFLESLRPDQVWGFRVTVNPTHRAMIGGAKKILGHVTVEQQTQWLLDRQEQMGVSFEIEGQRTCYLSHRSVRQFRRGNATVTLNQASFSGTLRVVDKDLLQQTLTQGVGRGKAYGCGLMTLARP